MSEEIGHILQNKVDLILDKLRSKDINLDEVMNDLTTLRDEIPCSCDSCEVDSDGLTISDELYQKCIDGEIDTSTISQHEFSAKDCEFLWGSANEYRREIEYFELYESEKPHNDEDIARCQLLANRLDAFADLIQKRLGSAAILK